MTLHDEVLVVGSGATGVHTAWSLLDAGRRVTMIDVGRERAAPVHLDADFVSLRERLEDPFAYLLGRNFESLILPGNDKEYYGFPPSKNHVFDVPSELAPRGDGFDPLVSLAAGGLAEAWTGGSYPFLDDELEAFPFDLAALMPFYDLVGRRIGIGGERDDLAAFFPWHDGIGRPVDLDVHGAALLEAYGRRRESFRRSGFFMGRARLAVLSAERDGRAACDKLGRCLWGCPRDSLWTPRLGLERLRAHPRFTYVGGVRVTHLDVDAKEGVRGVGGRDAASGAVREFSGSRVALACGTLFTARIVLETLRRMGRAAPPLRGLMDNRQILMPFVNPRLLGRPFDPRTYQYHQVAIGLSDPDPFDYVHGLVTTLKTALIHPIVQSLPLDLRGSLGLFRDAHAALGIVNVNFADRRRDENFVVLEEVEDGEARLLVRYRPDVGEPDRIAAALRRLRKGLLRLGCLAPSGMAHVRPMGASVHYAGTLPYSVDEAPLTTRPDGSLRPFENLFIVDGSTFPALPAKNLTLTLMANAARIASSMT